MFLHPNADYDSQCQTSMGRFELLSEIFCFHSWLLLIIESLSLVVQPPTRGGGGWLVQREEARGASEGASVHETTQTKQNKKHL